MLAGILSNAHGRLTVQNPVQGGDRLCHVHSPVNLEERCRPFPDHRVDMLQIPVVEGRQRTSDVSIDISAIIGQRTTARLCWSIPQINGIADMPIMITLSSHSSHVLMHGPPLLFGRITKFHIRVHLFHRRKHERGGVQPSQNAQKSFCKYVRITNRNCYQMDELVRNRSELSGLLSSVSHKV